MKKLSLLILVLLQTFMSHSQQWIDKKYQYDSIFNVVYGTALNFNGGIDTLKMDLYLPKCDDPNHVSKRPLLLWVHGGAFLAGDKSDPGITKLCKQFANRGYSTASINYRLGFVSDDLAWTCNFPNYSCVFAGDSAEWIRAYFRGIQDCKGALRYLINRQTLYKIDAGNVFIAGESAGAFIALGTALLDTVIEKPVQANAITAVTKPHANSLICQYNLGKTFTTSTVSRPNLGSIEGTIEPGTFTYTIRGIGNMYGAMLNNLLKFQAFNNQKPAIFSFHQPCDMVVPIDSGKVYEGLSWCMTNGYNCYGIKNTPKVYGSRAFSNWNITNAYGYTIHNEFTTVNFPYNFLIGAGSCLDQVNNPCHAYDNAALRENNLANYFAPLVSTNPICAPSSVTGLLKQSKDNFRIYPNPCGDNFSMVCDNFRDHHFYVINIYGNTVVYKTEMKSLVTNVNIKDLLKGIYFIVVMNEEGNVSRTTIVKE